MDIKQDIEQGKQLLVEDWRQAWKWLSMRFLALLTVMGTVQGLLRDNATDLGVLTQSKWFSYGMTLVAILGIIGRLLPQPVAEAIAKAEAVPPSKP